MNESELRNLGEGKITISPLEREIFVNESSDEFTKMREGNYVPKNMHNPLQNSTILVATNNGTTEFKNLASLIERYV